MSSNHAMADIHASENAKVKPTLKPSTCARLYSRKAFKSLVASRRANVKSEKKQDSNAGQKHPVLIVHFMRHGQGTHNLIALKSTWKCVCEFGLLKKMEPKCHYNLVGPDAVLTELGRKEASTGARVVDSLVKKIRSNNEELHAEKMTHISSDIDLLITSPLRRALETGLLALGTRLYKKGMKASLDQQNKEKDVLQQTTNIDGEDYKHCPPIILEELAREQYGSHLCDKRLSIAETKDFFESIRKGIEPYPRPLPLITKEMSTNEDTLWTEIRETKVSLADRAIKFVQKLWIIADKYVETKKDIVPQILVTTHSSFLASLVRFGFVCCCDEDTNQEEETNERDQFLKWFATGEVRSLLLWRPSQ